VWLATDALDLDSPATPAVGLRPFLLSVIHLRLDFEQANIQEKHRTMSFFNNEPQSWQAPVRQASWEQPPPPSRSGIAFQITMSGEKEAKNCAGASSTSQREESNAFVTQFEGT